MAGTARTRKTSLGALALVVGVGPFSTDTYIASLPEMQRELGTSSSAVQLTITFCIIGLAIGMLFAGPISDGIGRRPFILGGAVLFAVAGFVCALTSDVTLLLILRLIQGLAAGASASVGRAVIADRYSGVERAQKYGLLAAISLLSPVIAPIIGGVLHGFGGWRVIFVFMGALGIAMIVAALLGVPESVVRSGHAETGLATMGRRIGALLRRPAFLAPLVVQCLATAGFFVYIGGSAIVLETQLHISAATYSILFATNACGMVAMSLVFSRTVHRLGPLRLMWAGIGLSTAAVIALVAVALAQGAAVSLAAIWPLLVLVVSGMGLTQSASTVIGQNAAPDAAGTASSLLGGLAFLVGSATTPLTGIIGGGVAGMVVAMLVFFALSLGALAVLSMRRVMLTGLDEAPVEPRLARTTTAVE